MARRRDHSVDDVGCFARTVETFEPRTGEVLGFVDPSQLTAPDRIAIVLSDVEVQHRACGVDRISPTRIADVLVPFAREGPMSAQPPTETSSGAPPVSTKCQGLLCTTGRIGRLEYSLSFLFLIVWGNGGTFAIMASESAESRIPLYAGLIFWGPQSHVCWP
jgi:hypothetical protein